ncbi:MAG: PIN domain-containing protein [Thermoleophilia bacterium]
MILVDTSALYALTDRRDQHHKTATSWYAAAREAENTLAITQLIMAESWCMVERRKNSFYADKLWELMLSGFFNILDLDAADLATSLDIRIKYSDSKMSLVDATTLAICERLRIKKVFTYDRLHFGLYRPGFTDFLELVPAP